MLVYNSAGDQLRKFAVRTDLHRERQTDGQQEQSAGGRVEKGSG